MDEIVSRSMAKWPDVPAVYGWLSLDRRGNWLIKGERIGNAALREFIGRNYASDERGRWFFQNGPQRVYVHLAYTPLVVRVEGEGLVDHCGRPFSGYETLLDDEGSVLVSSDGVVALVDDRDLARFAEGSERFPVVPRAEVAARYGFDPDPRPN
jgi:hypothetical protein